MRKTQPSLEESIGTAFQERRKKVGMTQQEVATQMGSWRESISYVEREKRLNSIRKFDRLASVLGTRLWKIFKRADEIRFPKTTED